MYSTLQSIEAESCGEREKEIPLPSGNLIYGFAAEWHQNIAPRQRRSTCFLRKFVDKRRSVFMTIAAI